MSPVQPLFLRQRQWLDERLLGRPLRAAITAQGGVLLVGLLDYLSGAELSFFLFYLGPITLATWYVGARGGLGTALAAALVWLLADLGAGHDYSLSWMPVWNSAIRLGAFWLVVELLYSLHQMLLLEESLADTDPLTRLLNRRAFHEAVERESARAARHHTPFTLVYIDLDNFKQVNDTRGHDAGDELLRQVAGALRIHTRQADWVARLGGDEFALLLPQTEPEQVERGLQQLRLALLDSMQTGGWPVTFSIGAITWRRGGLAVRDLLRQADELMYQVKKQGKNDLRHQLL